MDLHERESMLNTHDKAAIKRAPAVFLTSAIPGVTGGAILLGAYFWMLLRAAGVDV